MSLKEACFVNIALKDFIFSINDLFQAMIKDSNLDIKNFNVDGGATANNLLLQTQANISEVNIIRPKIIETTAYGAALGAAIGKGLFKMDEIKTLWNKDQSFSANEDASFYSKKKEQWKQAIQKLFS